MENPSTARVLITSRNPARLDSYRQILASSQDVNFCVDLFSDGMQLVEALQSILQAGERIPLCILDTYLIPSSTLETLRCLRKLDPFMPVMLVTGSEQIKSDFSFDETQNVKFIQAPIQPEELLSMAATLVTGWNRRRQKGELPAPLPVTLEKPAFPLPIPPKSPISFRKGNSFRLRKRPDGQFYYVYSEGNISSDLHLSTCYTYGKTVSEVFGARAEVVIPLYERAFRGENVSYEIEFGPFNISTMLVPIEVDGEVVELVAAVSDLTEEKRIEKALKTSEEQLELVFEGADMGWWDWNYQTNQRSFSKQWAELLGYNLEELEPFETVLNRLVHPDDLDVIETSMDAHIGGLTPIYRAEYRLRTRTGQWRWSLSIGKVIEWDENHHPVRIAGINLDITELKYTEELMRLNEARYRAVVEDQTELILRFTPERVVTFVNQAYCTFTGKTVQEWIGRKRELKYVANAREIEDSINRISPENPVYLNDGIIPNAHGEERWIQWSTRAIFDSAGNVVEYQSVGRDTTEQWRTEVEIQSLRKATNSLLTSLDLDEVLNSILILLKNVIHYDSAAIHLRNGDFSEIVAGLGFPEDYDVIGKKLPISEEFIGHIRFSREPLVYYDAQVSSSFAGTDYEKKIRGWMGVPLYWHDEFIGFISLDSLEPGRFSQHSVELARDFANQAALAITNARLYRQLQDRLKEQSILNEISQAISSQLSLDDLLKAIYEQVLKYIRMEFFVIAIFDPQKDEWEPIFIDNPQADILHRRYPASNGLTGYVISHRESLLLNTIAEVKDFCNRTGYENIGEMPSSYLGAPMILSENVMGAIIAESRSTENAFDENSLSLLNTISSQVAVALENARLFEKTEEMAITDTLTGLFTRRHLFDLATLEFERAMRYHNELSVIMIDLDHFKNINDTYGHLAGDQVLQNAARQCRQALRKVDIIGRYGGEEFAVILPETSLESARQTAERLCQTIAATRVKTPRGIIKITASLGVSSLNNERNTLETLLDCADQALYAAKQAGRNRVIACPED